MRSMDARVRRLLSETSRLCGAAVIVVTLAMIGLAFPASQASASDVVGLAGADVLSFAGADVVNIADADVLGIAGSHAVPASEGEVECVFYAGGGIAITRCKQTVNNVTTVCTYEIAPSGPYVECTTKSGS